MNDLVVQKSGLPITNKNKNGKYGPKVQESRKF